MTLLYQIVNLIVNIFPNQSQFLNKSQTDRQFLEDSGQKDSIVSLDVMINSNTLDIKTIYFK